MKSTNLIDFLAYVHVPMQHKTLKYEFIIEKIVSPRSSTVMVRRPAWAMALLVVCTFLADTAHTKAGFSKGKREGKGKKSCSPAASLSRSAR